jgi:hypothetical protein
MELSDLAGEMNIRFKHVDERFEHVDERFKHVDERFTQVDERLAQIDERFNQVDNQFRELREQIVSEGEKTRRHFDIAVEQMKAERNLALDLSKATDERLAKMSASHVVEHAAFEAQLQDHENRLNKLAGQ